MLQNLLSIFKKTSSAFYKILIVVGVLVLIVKAFFIMMSDQAITTGTFDDVIAHNRQEIYRISNVAKDDPPSIAYIKNHYRWTTCTFMGEGCTDNPKDGDKNMYSSLIGKTVGLMILPLANPPASGIASVQSTLANAGLITKAQAAEGIGFASIRNYSKLWLAFRNLTFLILVAVLVVIGIMIMFRFKANPQTVVSIENSLPRFILTLIYISFSFAIAGFLIDFTYLLIFFVIEVMGAAFPTTTVAQMHDMYVTSNILGVTSLIGLQKGFYIYYDALRGLYALLPIFLQIPVTILGIYAQGWIINKAGTSFIGKIASFGGLCEVSTGVGGGFKICLLIASIIGSLIAGEIAPVILYFIGIFVILIGFLFLLFRLLFQLIGAYVQIIISIIFAPLFILREAIPGRSGFFPWVRRLFGHLMVFPTMITLFIVLRGITTLGLANSAYQPFVMPLLFGFNTDALVAIITGVFLFMIPDYVKLVVKTIAGDVKVAGSVGVLFGGAAVATKTGFGLLNQAGGLARVAGTGATVDPNTGAVVPGQGLRKNQLVNELFKLVGF